MRTATLWKDEGASCVRGFSAADMQVLSQMLNVSCPFKFDQSWLGAFRLFASGGEKLLCLLLTMARWLLQLRRKQHSHSVLKLPCRYFSGGRLKRSYRI